MEKLSKLYDRLVPRIRTPGSGAVWASDEKAELTVKTSKDYAEVYGLVEAALESVGLEEVSAERCARLTEAELDEIMGDGKRPVVFRGYAKSWSCVAEWRRLEKLEELAEKEEKEFEHRKYRVFSSDEKDEGRLHLTDGKAKAKLLSMRKFMDLAGEEKKSTSSYLLGIHEARGKSAGAFCPVQTHPEDGGRLPPMAEDVPQKVKLVEWYGKRFGADYDHQQFFLTKGYAYTDLHYDSYDNFYVAVRGTRRWTLAPPAVARWLLESGSGSLKSGSTVVPHKKLWGTHQIAQLFPFLTVELEPGDFLFVPACHWHLVESVPDKDGFSCAFNYFFSLDAIKTLSNVKALYQAVDTKLVDHQKLFRSLLTDPNNFVFPANSVPPPDGLNADQWAIIQRTLAATKQLDKLETYANLFRLTKKPTPKPSPLTTPKQSPKKENVQKQLSPPRKTRDLLAAPPSSIRTRSQTKRFGGLIL